MFDDSFKQMRNMMLIWMAIVFILGLGVLFILGKWLGVI